MGPSEHALQHPDDPAIFVDVDGLFWRRVNVAHPERRQWVLRRFEVDRDGYHRIRIAGLNRIAHREVYRVHVGALEVGLVVCHVNGDKTDNRPSNLMQATQAVNISHKREHGTWQSGDRHPRAKVGSANAARIKAALACAAYVDGRLRRGETIRIAAELGVSVTAVRDIRAGGWAHA